MLCLEIVKIKAFQAGKLDYKDSSLRNLGYHCDLKVWIILFNYLFIEDLNLCFD